MEKQVYPNHENWPGLIGQSLKKLQQRAGALTNPVELARMLVTGLDVLATDPVKKGWAKAVREGLTIGADALSPGTAIPQQMLPPLKAEVFADVVAVLQEAFPGRPLIFILDNLSAEAESSRAGVGTGVLLDFARSGFIHRKDIHFVVAWKHIAKTRPSFQELIVTIKQYQGREHRLEPMPREDADKWLRSDHPWYVGADDQQRGKVLRIAKGQPEVIAQWRDQGVGTLDFERLKSIENENQRYAPLAGELRSEKLKAQERLFQLAIMPVILGERALALLWEEDASSVHAFLEEWSSDPDRKGLLKRNDDGYLFAHEKKQHVARQTLAQALLENGAQSARILFDFFLSHVGFADKTHRFAPYYLHFALGLVAWAKLDETDRKWLAQAAALLADEGEVPSFGGAELNRLLAAPAHTRFFVVHRSLARLKTIEPWLRELDDSMGNLDGVELGNRAMGLVDSIESYGAKGESEQVEKKLDLLAGLTKDHAYQREIAVEYARGLFQAVHHYGRIGDFEQVRLKLNLLSELYGVHTQELGLAEMYLLALLAVELLRRLGHLERTTPIDIGPVLGDITEVFGDSGQLPAIRKLWAGIARRGDPEQGVTPPDVHP